MPLKYQKYTPDRLDKGLRLGCGGLFGAFAGLLFVGRLFRHRIVGDAFLPLLALGSVLGAVLCAGLALKKGDRFWALDVSWGDDRWFRFWLIGMGLLLLGFILWLNVHH